MVTSPYDSRAAYASATLRPRTRASSAAASSGCQARAVTLTAIVTRPSSPRGSPAGPQARLVEGQARRGRRERQLERLDFLPEQALGGRLGGGVAHGRRVLHERRPRRRRGRLGPGRRGRGVGGGRKGGPRP